MSSSFAPAESLLATSADATVKAASPYGGGHAEPRGRYAEPTTAGMRDSVAVASSVPTAHSSQRKSRGSISIEIEEDDEDDEE